MPPVFRQLADELAAAGVSAVFGLMGEDTAPLVTELPRVGVRYFSAAHENVAVAMADGYAWAAGEPGVAVASRGPGLTNALTALTTAAKAHRPVVVIAGEAATARVSTDLKSIDMEQIAAAAGVAYVRPQEAGGVVAGLREALASARRGRCTVLAVPANLFLAEAPPGDGEPDGALRATEDAAGAIDAEELRRAVELLEGSSRPLLLVGRGGLTPGAHDAFVALADRLGALLGTTLPARSLFAGHPFDAGVVGGFSTDTARSVLQEVDCVAAFGASLNIFTRAHGELIDGARLVQVDRDPGQIGAALAADAGVVGDAVAVARAMLDALGPDGPGDAPLRRPEVRDALAEPTVFADPGAGGPPIDPRRLTTTLDALLPAPRVVVTDGGHFAGFPATALRVAEPGHFRMTADFGSVGMGLGAAMGAAVARPDLRTVLCIGDGGLLMTLGDLSSLARHGLGVTVVVFNDQAYGAERHFLDLEGLAPESASLPDVTFAPIAAALGIPAHDVRTLEELEALAGPLGADDGPLLLDCRIDPTVRAQWLEDLDAHRKRQYAAAPA